MSGAAWAAIGSAGLDFMGGLMTNASNARSAADSLQAQERGAQRAMDFSERMSSTAHQREVADLRAAGLNPLLSRNAGAAAPSGAGVGGATAHFQNPFSGAQSAARLHEELKNLRETNTNIRADTELKSSARALNSVLYNRTLEETDRERVLRQTDQERLKGAQTEGKIDEGRYGAALRYLDRLRGTASSASSLMRHIR